MPGTETHPGACLCGSTAREVLFAYTAPPAGEPAYAFSRAGGYVRRVERCPVCGHCIAVHALDTTRLYEGDYDTAIYGPRGLRAGYDRILALDPNRSDNAGRVRRILSFFEERLSIEGGSSLPERSVLDVGSGLCVFLHRMKEAGWRCAAVDPDARAVRHAAEVVGVEAAHGDYATLDLTDRFRLVTFNKVLEHVADPVAVLKRAHRNLGTDGIAYVEVPDAEAAAEAGADREEFFVDHLHVFSAASLALLARHAGFRVEELQRIHEPSGKFTLYAFLAPSSSDSSPSSRRS